MPAGLPYFAWIDPGETAFEEAHKRWDENVFSFSLSQGEGDPASLTVQVRRPRNVAGDPIGLLGPGRKIWAWFALDCGDDELVKFRGRLVGVPTSIFEELVTLEFVARPIDFVAQKEALADTLRVLPYYDEVVLDPARRTDADIVLEGYAKVWHFDRETHEITVSDEITGEDGLVEFDGESEDGKALYDGLGLTLTSGPLARVDVNAEFTWTQQATGNVDLTEYLTGNWPNEEPYTGIITSFTFGAEQWPKNGAAIGEGWVVAESTSDALYDLTVHNTTIGGTVKMGQSSFGTGSTTVTQSRSESYLTMVPPGSIQYGHIVTSQESSVTYSDDGDGSTYASSMNSSVSVVAAVLPLLHTRPTLLAGYKAARQCTELVSFSLFADVQHVLTDPVDGEAMRIDDIKSVNLSERLIGVGTDGGTEGYIPIGDPRRRSYIATERGNSSVEHLIALARAHLMKRSRVVEITFAPRLARMPEITLRKNAFLIEPRVGEALGKIISYSLSLDGSDGRINCEVRIGCAIGHGGSAVAAGGDPTYCSETYTGPDYQQFSDRVVLFDTSVGYQPPYAAPNDDGINFLSVLRAADVIQAPLVVTNPPAVQRVHINNTTATWSSGFQEYSWEDFAFGQDPRKSQAKQPQVRSEAIGNALKEVETRATFKLKNMNRAFSTDYQIQVTQLKIPTGYDLTTT